MQYSEMQEYGFNKIIKEYARFPKYLPLPCHMDHGWNVFSECSKTDLLVDKPLMLVFSKRFEAAWKKQCNTQVAVMGSPFVHYKNMHKITQKKDADGTIAFPSHRTAYIESKFSKEKYCDELAALPVKFQPVTVCLFWQDFYDTSADYYRKRGFKVVTAGSKIGNSLEFVENFYDLLSSHKYSTSNDIGSYAFYAVDLGIPFFLTGEEPVLCNDGCQDINIAEKSTLGDFEVGRKAKKLFLTGPRDKITNEQQKFVDDEMGTNDCLSPKELNKLLWKQLKAKRFWFKYVLAYWLISFLMLIHAEKFVLKVSKVLTRTMRPIKKV